MSGPLQIAYFGPEGRIVATDSLTYCDERIRTTDIVVGGSYIGAFSAAFALRSGARGVIGNAAGVGKDQAGIGGLPLADRWGAPCVAVSEQSARLADGQDTYDNGVISHVNQAARELGVREGVPCSDAARLMLAGPLGEVGRAADLVTMERVIAWQGPEGRVAVMASVSLAQPENAGDVICAGSHTALVTWRYVSAYTFPVAGIICNDAGVGKERSGIAGLEPLAQIGVAAASVSHESARIGDPRSTYDDGIISFANGVAEQAGVRAGMSAHDAAIAMLKARF